jgi:hypothetical protein
LQLGVKLFIVAFKLGALGLNRRKGFTLLDALKLKPTLLKAQPFHASARGVMAAWVRGAADIWVTRRVR